MKELKEWLTANEGYKEKPYTCSAGKLSVGVGRNLTDNGLRPSEIDFMLENDIKAAIKELQQYSWYLTQPNNVQMALINMCFNLGMPRLLGFRNMIRALINFDYETAAKEALDSKWAKQVGNRANQIANKIREAKS